MATIVNLICKECGISFNVKKGNEKMFCSKKCKSDNRHKIDEIYFIEKDCKCCSKTFRSKIKENKIFCSYKCFERNKNMFKLW